MDLPFDTVVVDQGVEQRRLSAADFLRLPLDQRIELILGRRIEFKKGELTVARTIALQSLMAAGRGP